MKAKYISKPYIWGSPGLHIVKMNWAHQSHGPFSPSSSGSLPFIRSLFYPKEGLLPHPVPPPCLSLVLSLLAEHVLFSIRGTNKCLQTLWLLLHLLRSEMPRHVENFYESWLEPNWQHIPGSKISNAPEIRVLQLLSWIWNEGGDLRRITGRWGIRLPDR